MSDCEHCPVERLCHYPYKPCECFDQRKFWDEQRRMEWDATRGVGSSILRAPERLGDNES